MSNTQSSPTEHFDDDNDSTLITIANLLERFVLFSARIICWVYPLLIFAILLNVVLRYGFSSGLIIFEEIQWHLYAIGMLFGLSYAEITNSQVKVDIVAGMLKTNTVRLWEVFGSLFLILPFVFVVIFNSYDYILSSYKVGESSNSPLGLPFRWAIKAVIPLSFSFLAIAVISRMLRNIHAIITSRKA